MGTGTGTGPSFELPTTAGGIVVTVTTMAVRFSSADSARLPSFHLSYAAYSLRLKGALVISFFCFSFKPFLKLHICMTIR